MKYPNSYKEYLQEHIHGHKVEDSYRWMENESDDRLRGWVDAQNALTQSYLKTTGKTEAIKERLASLYGQSSYGDLRVIGDKIIYAYNDGHQNQAVYYIVRGQGPAEVLLDPNSLSDDGCVAVFLNGHSKDKRYLSFLQSSAGSDWHVLKVIDLETGKVLDEALEWIKFTFVSWQGQGFYYSAYQPPVEGKVYSDKNSDMKIYYHSLGQSQDKDRLVYEDLDNALSFHSVFVSSDEKTLILSSRQGTYGGEILCKRLGQDHDFKKVIRGFDNDYHYIGSKDDRIFFMTDDKAANKKIVQWSASRGDFSEVVGQKKAPLEDAYYVNDHLILVYLEDVISKAYLYDLQGKLLGPVDLPGMGMVDNFVGDCDHDHVYFSYTSFLEPRGYYRLNMNDYTSEVYKGVDLGYDKDQYESKQIFCTSKDGCQVPVFLTYKKGLRLDGKNPTLLYAYGGFGISLRPAYDPKNIYLIEAGGIYAQACIRGGSEYGEAWHKAGMLDKKQNVYDDYIGVAETLIAKKYTSPAYMAFEGRSNGGLLMGVIANQRPDLCAVVFPAVGVMDMVRYHRFTIGWGWASEYGNPDDQKHFENVYKYSPLHKIEEKDYPAVMVFTGDHDDRVVPAHSFKYVARLQEMNTSDQATLVRIDKDAGHGAGKSVDKLIDEAADKFAFMFDTMKV